jgi:hypothetical protein
MVDTGILDEVMHTIAVEIAEDDGVTTSVVLQRWLDEQDGSLNRIFPLIKVRYRQATGRPTPFSVPFSVTQIGVDEEPKARRRRFPWMS